MKLPSKKEAKRYLIKITRVADKHVYMLSIIFALAVVTSLLIYSYLSVRRPEGYISFSVLDSQKTAENYPEILVIGKNNTCQLWLSVENCMEKEISCKVFLKIINQPISTIPVLTEPNESYEMIIQNGEKWEKLINVTVEKTGNFHLIFELWIYNKEKGEFEFSDKYVVLNVEVRES